MAGKPMNARARAQEYVVVPREYVQERGWDAVTQPGWSLREGGYKEAQRWLRSLVRSYQTDGWALTGQHITAGWAELQRQRLGCGGWEICTLVILPVQSRYEALNRPS